MTHDEFQYTTELDIRLRDLDLMGHVNNGVYATYLEQAREDYFRDVLDKGLLDNVNTVTAKQTIEYAQPINADCRTVAIGVRVADVSEKSLTIKYEIRADGAVAATGSTVQVAYDMNAGKSLSIPDRWREQIKSHETA
jgi:acyl-CoA thioester hydrolase